MRRFMLWPRARQMGGFSAPRKGPISLILYRTQLVSRVQLFRVFRVVRSQLSRCGKGRPRTTRNTQKGISDTTFMAGLCTPS